MFFSFFLFIYLCILIPAVTTQISNPMAAFVIPINISTKETKAEIETHPITDNQMLQ